MKKFELLCLTKYFRVKLKPTMQEQVDEQDEWDKRINKTNCSVEHVALMDCHYESKDFRKCLKEMKAFKDCFALHLKERDKEPII